MTDVRIVFAGDSLVAGVGDETALGWVGRVLATARQAGHDVTGYNLGVRRETTPEVVARLRIEAPPRLRDGDVRALVLSTGVNDTTTLAGTPRCSVDATVEAIGELLTTADEAGWAMLVVGPPLVADAAQNARIAERSAAIATLCAQRRVTFIDVAGPLAGDSRWATEVAAGDGSHPGSRGYELLARLIDPGFASWLATVTP